MHKCINRIDVYIDRINDVRLASNKKRLFKMDI